jgi:hypothetical protein
MIFLSACTPAEIISPTASVTISAPATATGTPLPTETPTLIPSTATATSTPKPFAALQEISLAYLAETEADASLIAQNLNYLGKSAHPSNMCGPLAAEILRKGGVISPYTDIYDFWLLNPRINGNILKEAFPKSRFNLTEIRIPILDYDFSKSPLKEGDFLYLYAGTNGTFEHMLAVTRVDKTGKAYSVTNLNTDDGYIVSEFMLYDPNSPEEGLFNHWNNREYDHLGLTGSGGFDIWRPKSSWDNGNAMLNTSINKTLENMGGDWHILIKELGGETLYARNIHKVTHIASIIKVPIALLFMKSIQARSGDLENYLASHAFENRSYEQLISAMLVNSEEPATGSIYNIVQKNGLNIVKTLEDWGIEEISIPYRTATLYDLSMIYEGLYQHEFVSEKNSKYILDLMGEYTENDDERSGVLKDFFSEATIYNKRGTLTDQFLVIGDAAIIEVNEKAYIVIIVGNQDQYGSANNTDLSNTLESLIHLFGDYLLSEE